MKLLKNIVGVIALLSVSLAGASAASTTLAAWNFDNNPIAINSAPTPSAGIGVASALGMDNTYNNTNSTSNPDVQGLPGNPTSNTNCWRIRGYSLVANQHGNGWSTNAPIGSQGAQFTGSTYGYNKVKVSFDVYATSDAEANLQVQYTVDGKVWINATNLTIGGTAGTLESNDGITDPYSVTGTYVKLASGWNTNITADLTGIAAVDNNTNFAVRLVNASANTSCVNTTGTLYNNLTGNWSFDNVVISGTSIDTIVDWTFESYPSVTTVVTSPVPEIGSGTAQSIGFNNGYTYLTTPPSVGSVDASDITGTPGSSTASINGTNAWRVRGANPSTLTAGVGWNYAAPIGTQGFEFDVSTVNYTNITVTFDLYFTSKAEAKMCVLYCTNLTAGTPVWLTANSLGYAAKPSFVLTNTSNPNIVTGTYFFETNGQGFYNNIVVDLTGVPNVDGNPNFGIRIVNAATGATDCTDNTGTTPYNNSSGNTRIDNVQVGGTAGVPPPTLAIDPKATVDGPFTNTFTDDPIWRGKIVTVYVNGLALPAAAYNTNNAGKIIFTPANSSLLQSSGTKNISFFVPGYGTARIAQPLAAGVATQLALTAPAVGPTASGGTLVVNPILLVADQYLNGTTNPYQNVTVVATVGGAGAWTLGGSNTQSSVNGQITFTNLSATLTGATPINNAYITYTVTGYTPISVTNSATFSIGAPPTNYIPGDLAVFQYDTQGNNTTFSIIELKPSVAGQINPVNIVPISSTGTNALRNAAAGSGGRLGLNDTGTLLCFGAYVDGSSATPDETLNLNRVAVALDYTNKLTIGLHYASTSLGGSQARSCTELTDPYGSVHWLMDDKGGLYDSIAGDNLTSGNANTYNNVVVRTFGGKPWVETQKSNGASLPVLYQLGVDTDTGIYDLTPAAPIQGLTGDAQAGDFYMISTNGGTSYDVLYIIDQNNETNGAIKKFSFVSGSWVSNGAFTNKTGGDSLFATTNGAGGVSLYLTTAPKTGNNSLIKFTDAAGWGGTINIISTNVIYTATGSAFLKGITFVPQATANASEPIPPPVLTAQATASVSGVFAITNTPDDPLWRSSITAITVNGTLLPTAAYTNTITGKIVFDPAKSGGVLTTAGANNIVFSSTGYSTNSVVQNLSVGAPAKLAIATEPSTPVGVGAAFGTQPAIYIEDTYGNVVTTANSNVVAQVGLGNGTLTGSTSATAVAGVATFSGLVAPTVAQNGLKLAFSSATLANVTNATAITVNPGAPAHLAFGQQPSTTVAGVAISPAVTVIVQDAYGNTVTSDTSSVSIVSLNTGFTVDSTLSVNAIAGVATFSNLKPTTAGPLKTLGTIDASEVPIYVFSSPFTVAASTPSQLAIATQPASPLADGGALATQPVVVIEDQYGNFVTTATSNIVAQASAGTWTLGGTTTKAAVSGTATFTGLTATSSSATSANIWFTSGSLTGVTSTAFTIPAPAASSLGGVKLSNGQFVFASTNITGLTISVLSTNNLTVPRPWPVVGTAVEGPSGIYNYTNGTPTNGQQFYYTQP